MAPPLNEIFIHRQTPAIGALFLEELSTLAGKISRAGETALRWRRKFSTLGKKPLRWPMRLSFRGPRDAGCDHGAGQLAVARDWVLTKCAMIGV